MVSYNIQVGHTLNGQAVSTTTASPSTVPPMTTNINVGDVHANTSGSSGDGPSVVRANSQVPSSSDVHVPGVIPTNTNTNVPPSCAARVPVPGIKKVPVSCDDACGTVTPSVCSRTTILQKDVVNGFYAITKPGHYDLGESLVFDYMDTNDTQVIDGKLNPLFFGGFRTADASVGIAICCDDVYLHGNGHGLKQSLRSALTNRVFTLVELSANSRAAGAAASRKSRDGLGDNSTQARDCPLYAGNNDRTVAAGGPSHVDDNYSENAGLKNITLENIHFGRSSHFSIHGTNNRNLTVRNCKFIDFEIAAVWLNNPIQPILQKLDIVGFQLVQPPTYLQGFSTQGSGRFGVVNSSYWGIIFNQSYGGVNLTFPQPSGGPLTSLHAGVPSDYANSLVEDNRRPGQGGQPLDTGDESNFQRIGARGGLVEDVNISELSTLATSGVCVSRMRSDGVCVPILTRIDRKPGAYADAMDLRATNIIDRVTPFGQGFKGMRFNKHMCIEAVRDFRAFYVNKYCIQWMKANINDEARCKISDDEKVALSTLLAKYTIVESHDDPNLIHLEDLVGNVIPDEDQHTWGRYGFKLLKVNTRKPIVHGTDVSQQRHSYLYDPDEYGYSYYRGKDGDRSENFLYGFSSCEPLVDGLHVDQASNSYGLPSRDIVSYRTLVHSSDQVAFATCFRLERTTGTIPYRRLGRVDGTESVYANVQIPTVVLPIKECWLVKHCVDMFGQPWYTSKDVSFQLARGMALDEGGHSFNGLVAIHCDRMWGVTFRNVNVVNATKPDTGLDPHLFQNLA